MQGNVMRVINRVTSGRYDRLIGAICSRILYRYPELVDDAMQATKLKILMVPAESLGDTIMNEKGFVAQYARYGAIDILREEKHHDMLTKELGMEINWQEPKVQEIHQLMIDERLSELPPRQREALVRSELFGQSLAEVGESMNISSSAAWSLVTKAWRNMYVRKEA